MRIHHSYNYYHIAFCPFRYCQRMYCHEHRLLYRDCDTAQQDIENDRGWELGECPECEKDSRRKYWEKAGKLRDEYYAQSTKKPR
jgi:hypothetical protein